MFYVCNLTANLKDSTVEFNDLKLLNAMVEDRDVFKVKQLLAIPNSDIVILVDELYGLYFYDLDSLAIIQEFDLKDEDYYQDMDLQTLSTFRVYTVAGNWPFEIQILTSEGIFVFNFETDLCQRSSIFPYYDKTLQPISKRLIR